MMPEPAEDLAAIARIDSVRKILEVICRTTGLGFSAVARVTDRRWIACAVRDEIAFGLVEGGELPIETTICNTIRQCGEPIVIDNVPEDPAYADHPIPQLYGFKSYASFPIRLPDGRFFGTLCAIDPRPARLNTPAITTMFSLFAELIGMHIHSLNRIAVSEAALIDERQISQLREQFIAVLGHDLRNPLGAINAAASLLRMSDLTEDDVETVDMIQRSTTRMAGIINNVLDFARGRLGTGLDISPTSQANLTAIINQVVAELKSSSPQREFETTIAIDRAFDCDGPRIAQMLSNLIANALTHGNPDSPVWIRAETSTDNFELSVTNLGKTIPPDVIPRLFEPFVRGSTQKGHVGLGLGLYIASEIAKAHRGVLTVVSANNKTCFTFRVPIAQAKGA